MHDGAKWISYSYHPTSFPHHWSQITNYTNHQINGFFLQICRQTKFCRYICKEDHSGRIRHALNEGSTLEKKEFALWESKFFLLKSRPIDEVVSLSETK